VAVFVLRASIAKCCFSSAERHPLGTVVLVATCPGSLILHRDGTVAGCRNDDDADGGRGRDLRQEGDPTARTDWFEGCSYCGVHWSARARVSVRAGLLCGWNLGVERGV
jgi:hypothetical protein